VDVFVLRVVRATKARCISIAKQIMQNVRKNSRCKFTFVQPIYSSLPRNLQQVECWSLGYTRQ